MEQIRIPVKIPAGWPTGSIWVKWLVLVLAGLGGAFMSLGVSVFGFVLLAAALHLIWDM